MRTTSVRILCPFDECEEMLTVTISAGSRATHLDPAEPPELQDITKGSCEHASAFNAGQMNDADYDRLFEAVQDRLQEQYEDRY